MTIKCHYCNKHFQSENARWQHAKMKHPGRKNPSPKREQRAKQAREKYEPSMASRVIDAQIALMCGEEIEIDLALMFDLDGGNGEIQ